MPSFVPSLAFVNNGAQPSGRVVVSIANPKHGCSENLLKVDCGKLTVVLRCNKAALCTLVHTRLIMTAIAKVKLERLCSSSKSKQLITCVMSSIDGTCSIIILTKTYAEDGLVVRL